MGAAGVLRGRQLAVAGRLPEPLVRSVLVGHQSEVRIRLPIRGEKFESGSDPSYPDPKRGSVTQRLSAICGFKVMIDLNSN